MKTVSVLIITILCLCLPGIVLAQVPGIINYQGRVTVAGTNFDGTGQFKFALVNANGSETFWSNGLFAVSLPVTKGLYSVLLGDTSITNMDSALPATVFTQNDVRLRVWFDDGVSGLQQLTPKQRLAAVGYALMSARHDASADLYALRLNVGTSNTLNGSYATIAGGFNNATTSNCTTIAGGYYNTASYDYATVGGGGFNTANGSWATVGGGKFNTANSPYATIAGGYYNTASGWYATVGGGDYNTANGSWATVGGGDDNTASGTESTVAGGTYNIASGDWATVGGGHTNTASNWSATVGGGEDNIASGWYGTVGGGDYNTANGDASTISGGYTNTASGDWATVGGGDYNIASGVSSTVGGGHYNQATNFYATVPGGYQNVAGGTNSFAAGNRAKANHNGAFVWADNSTTANLSSSANNQFTARAAGGVRFFSDSGAAVGVQLAAGGNSWSAISDRNAKENFEELNSREVLDRLVRISVTKWNLKSQPAEVRHIGPMAQDFYAAFGVGEDDRHISTSDADGVAFAAIRGLYEVVKEKDARVAELEKRLAELERRLDQGGK